MKYTNWIYKKGCRMTAFFYLLNLTGPGDLSGFKI